MRLKQGDCKSKASLGYTGRTVLKKKNRLLWFHYSVLSYWLLLDLGREEILSSNVSTLVRHTHQAPLNGSESVVIETALVKLSGP